MAEKRASVITKSLIQINSINEAGLNLNYDQTIHWFKHYPAKGGRSDSQTWLNDSLIQAPTCLKREEWLNDSLNHESWPNDSLIQILPCWLAGKRHWVVSDSLIQKEFQLIKLDWMSLMTKWFTDSNNDSFIDRGVNVSHDWTIHWFKH